jgi:hypothetical protein
MERHDAARGEVMVLCVYREVELRRAASAGTTEEPAITVISYDVRYDVRGSAFGIFNLISGLMLLVASTIAGLLWDWFGASATF